MTEDGASEVELELSDQITTFKVTVNAYSKLGLYGLVEYRFSSNKPLAVAFNLPPNMVQGDSLIVPISIKSNLAQPMDVTLALNSSETKTFSLDPYETKVINKTIIADNLGNLSLRVTARGFLQDSSNLQDSLTKQTEVLPRGFPIRLSSSGILKPGN